MYGALLTGPLATHIRGLRYVRGRQASGPSITAPSQCALPFRLVRAPGVKSPLLLRAEKLRRFRDSHSPANGQPPLPRFRSPGDTVQLPSLSQQRGGSVTHGHVSASPPERRRRVSGEVSSPSWMWKARNTSTCMWQNGRLIEGAILVVAVVGMGQNSPQCTKIV